MNDVIVSKFQNNYGIYIQKNTMFISLDFLFLLILSIDFSIDFDSFGFKKFTQGIFQ